MDVTCLIPAFNEGKRIGAVLDAVLGHPDLARVLVVDDGSSDDTAKIARGKGAEVLCLEQNAGKSGALARGLALVQTSHVLLIDADLQGLTPQNVSQILHPVLTGQSDVSLSLRGNTPLFWRLIGLDYITGERVIPMSLCHGAGPTIAALPGFGFEVFLNDRIIEHGLRTAVVPWPGVSSPMKRKKSGIVAGSLADLFMLRDIVRTIGLSAVGRQIVGLLRLGA